MVVTISPINRVKSGHGKKLQGSRLVRNLILLFSIKIRRFPNKRSCFPVLCVGFDITILDFLSLELSSLPEITGLYLNTETDFFIKQNPCGYVFDVLPSQKGID